MRLSNISIHALLAESDLRPLYLAHVQQHFYPRSPCGERRHKRPLTGHALAISIHALLAESDGDAWYIMRKCAISIHALLAESDWC